MHCQFGIVIILLLLLQNFADNLSKKFGSQINELWDSFGQDFTYPGNLPAYVEEYFEEETQPTKAFNRDISGSVQCLPLPGELHKHKNTQRAHTKDVTLIQCLTYN